MRRIALLVVLAGCPPQGASTGPQAVPSAQSGAGCPGGSGVYIASYVTNEPGKGRAGWVMPLHAMQVDPGASEHVPDYAPMDATAASVSGVPAAPAGNAWLVTAQAAPCKLTLGGYYAAKLPGPPASLSYGIELEGCPAPADPQEDGGLVMFSDQAPGGCQVQGPNPIALRLGDTDQQQQWHRPAKETPIPEPIASIVPPHDCRPPTCEPLWAIGEVDVAGKPAAWSAAVNWLATDNATAQCTWHAERWSGFFVPGPDGKPLKITEGQDHPLALSAVLSDATGPRVALADGPGAFATYDLTPGAARLAHAMTWMLAPDGAWEMIDHLGPICAPPEAKPAPLPKDAKPVSPYPP